MKSLKIMLILVLSIFTTAFYSDAGTLENPLYSRITTSFVLTKTAQCDEVKAKFRVFAEGDNYSMALKRLATINNNFIGFLKKTFSYKDVKTSSAYGYSKTAAVYVSIKSRKISAVSDILRYIANKNFQYKTGIKPVYIRFTVSDKLKNKIKNQLFMEALNRATSRLAVVNGILSKGYKIESLNVETNSSYPILYERNAITTFYKSASKSNQEQNNIQTSPGSMTIKVQVKLTMTKKLD